MDNFYSSFTHVHKNMEMLVLFFVLLLVDGVFDVTDEIQSVSVMEGESVTLRTDVTEIQKADLILWTFGLDSTRIAQINRLSNKVSLFDEVLDGRFRGRLKLAKTVSLTITNTTTEHRGVYELQTFGGNEVPPRKFSIIVYARLPVPVISTNSSQCSSSSSSYCSLVCSSVVNVSHVTLSWFKGNSLLSSISASDLSISLSLPLEVKYQDKNTYSCVLNNPISHQTQHLDITQLCHTCAAAGLSAGHISLLCVCVLAVAAVVCGIYHYHERKTSKRTNQGGGDTSSNEDRYSQNGAVPLLAVEVDGGDTSNHQERNLPNSVFVKEDKITSVPVMEGEPITLHNNDTEIEEMEMIWWKFASSKERNCAKFVVIATLSKTNNEEDPHNKRILQFKDSLKLDQNTGSLTITKITPKHYGHYKLHITSKGQMIVHTFRVFPHFPLNKEQTPTQIIQRRQTCP
ncbi:hepatic and glial cell adhesion molecule-like [Pseudorasbora parva]|uniref:hepatic and glial cell adhesion molecule-like n=1 Tax=Pseudorasbora parva TaxID=51549 RepID=UPI00351E3B35